MICSSMLTELAWVKMKLRTKLVLESPIGNNLAGQHFNVRLGAYPARHSA